MDDTAGLTAGRIGQAVITTLAVVLLIALPRLWRATASDRPSH